MAPSANRGGKPTAAALLRQLRRVAATFGGEATRRKLALLRRLDRGTLTGAKDVRIFHDLLCFLRAYPDNDAVLRQVEATLRRFERRTDLRRHRKRLADSGIAGTTIEFPFFWFTAQWLARRWPDRLTIAWDGFEAADSLEGLLAQLMPHSETPALDEWAFSVREWLDRLKSTWETDAAFLVRRFDALDAGSALREKLFDDLELPVRLEPGKGTPSRTLDRDPRAPVVFQTGPLDLARPDLRKAARETRLSVRTLSPREGRRYIELARAAMATRSRDLDNFEYADDRDVRLFDAGGGYRFACIGSVPERRLMLESVYGFLTLKNGMPVGYVLASGLMNSSEVAYNIFETFRGAEAAAVYGRVLAMVRHLFGADSFTIDPYQLGHDNEEGLESGAWWFYYKLGFRPHDAAVRRLLRKELARMKRRPGHRSSIATLQELSAENLFFYLERERRDILGRINLGNIGMAIVDRLRRRHGGDREAALRECSQDAAKLLGVRSFRGFSAGERLWWDRWSPLVMALPGIRTWPAADKRALVKVVRAKGGRHESDFVPLFDAHRRLRRAVLKLAQRS